MFRRRWSGLPKDPKFPDNLKGLGYFINEQDEVRSIENPDTYFKYFIKKNERWNERQRFAMNNALSKEIEKRLFNVGCRPVPTYANGNEPVHLPDRVPILVTLNAPTANHIVVIIGESTQDLGVLAHRVIGGSGGINKGSLVDTVKYLRNGETDVDGDVAVAIANPGQCNWWPEGSRCLTDAAWNQKPRRSAVTYAEKIDLDRNVVEGHQTPREHIRTFFKNIVHKNLLTMKGDKASIRGDIKTMSIIALGDSAELVEEFLDEKENWDTYGPHLVSLAIIGGFFDREQITNPAFAEFMKTRARAYIVSQQPTDTPMATWTGNPLASHFTNYGCPVFSSGEPYYTEMMFITAHKSICDFILKTASDPDYVNPEIEVTYVDEAVVQNLQDENPWAGAHEQWVKEQEAEQEAKAIEALVAQTAQLQEQEVALKLQKEKIEEELAAMKKQIEVGNEQKTAIEKLLTSKGVTKADLPDAQARLTAMRIEEDALQVKVKEQVSLMDEQIEKLEEMDGELRAMDAKCQAMEAKYSATPDTERDELDEDPVAEQWPERVQHWNAEQAALGNKDLEKLQAEVAAGDASPMRLVAEEFAAKCAVDGESVTLSEATEGSPAITVTPPALAEIPGNCSSTNRISVQGAIDSFMDSKREVKPEAEVADEEIPHSLSAKSCNA